MTSLATLYEPHMITPPRPDLLRIWSPVMVSISASLFVLVTAIHIRRTTWSPRRRAFVYVAAGVAIWLVTPAVRIMCDPKNDCHAHELIRMPQGKCYCRAAILGEVPRIAIVPDLAGQLFVPGPGRNATFDDSTYSR